MCPTREFGESLPIENPKNSHLHYQNGVPVLEKNKKTSTEAAKPGLISPGRMPGTGSLAGIPGAAQKNICHGIVHRSARFVPGIFGEM